MNILAGRPVAGLESNHNVSVHGADWRRVAVRHIDGAVWQPDVVDDAGELGARYAALDGGFDEIAEPRRFFDSSSSLGAKVKIELARVGSGKEILAQPWEQQRRGGAESEKHGQEDRATLDAAAQ